jgi:hypothetical protein
VFFSRSDGHWFAEKEMLEVEHARSGIKCFQSSAAGYEKNKHAQSKIERATREG